MNKFDKILVGVVMFFCLPLCIHTVQSLYAVQNTIMNAGSPFDDGAGGAKFDGQVVFQTDKYIVCDVFTSTGINACIALLNGPGTVELLEGRYSATTKVTMLSSSQTLVSFGGAIIDASAGFESPAPSMVIDTNDMDFIRILGITFIGETGGGTSVNLIGDDDDADFLTIQNCVFQDWDNIAIRTAGENTKIVFNTFIRGDAVAIDYGGDFGVLNFNTFNNTATSCIETVGKYLSIVGNTMNTPGRGIDLGAPGKHCTINGNTITGAVNDGIRVANSGFNTVSSNDIENSNTGAEDILVTCDFNTITGNVLFGDGASDRGIYLDEADECVVTGNFTDGHDIAGIQEDSDCQNNLIYGNNAQDSTPYILNGTLPESIRMPSQTEAQLKTITPRSVGELYWDSTNTQVVVSTGTAEAAFGKVADGNTPTGW